MGHLAYDLGNYSLSTGKLLHNRTVLVSLLYSHLEDTSLVADMDEAAFARTRGYIEGVITRLEQAEMERVDAELVEREYKHAVHLLFHACRLGEFKKKLERVRTPEERFTLQMETQSLAHEMRGMIAAHRRLWFSRNRPGGLKERSLPGLQRLLREYRQFR